MPIVIPKRLEKLLKKEPAWLTDISRLCAHTVNLYQDSPMFFPDYTIHGVEHINEVLSHADALIDPKTLKRLTPRDTAFLIAAILLHDAGMFLRPDGVRKLVIGNRRHDTINNSGDDEWGKVWTSFVDRTKRYPEEKMRYLFGQNITVRETCISTANMTDNDKRIIGDFLRQNHGRMAHEIAVNGLPGSTDIDLFACTGFTPQDRDLIGLLARSHTMLIRDTESYVRKVFGKGSMPYNTPLYYLMVVLRIADALDAGRHRISKFRDTQERIRVPISVEEWVWNERINRSICRWDLDELSRYIYAEPKSSIEYVQLDKWLRQTQSELDLCWSILAEKYADKPYRLTIHRILCNIHETEVQEAMNDRFLTQEVKVTANPEVTKLMMAPLYGQNPSYGVRELLQNAVDACIEREEKDRKANRSYQGRVLIRLDAQTFSISDNGIGMDKNVLLNYYLCAGASYRSSDEWKQTFTKDGETTIARTGRFGVGFLAAFLLGNTIEVCTQHIDDKKGYAFSFNQDSRPLDIMRIFRPEGPGTTITIRLKEGVYDTLKKNEDPSWLNWFVFDNPVVDYYIDGMLDKNHDAVLSRDPKKNAGWFTLDSQQYSSYQWNSALHSSGFFCNGIRIQKVSQPSLANCGLDVSIPAISVMDHHAALNVDLARSTVTSFPEWDTFLEQFFRFHIARLLMVPWNTAEDRQTNLQTGFPLDYSQNVPFLLSSDGYQLNYASCLSALGITEYMLLYSSAESVLQGINKACRALPSGTPFVIAPDLRSEQMNSQGWQEYGAYTGSPLLFTEGFLSSSIPILGESRLKHDPVRAWRYAWIEKESFNGIHSYQRNKLTARDWKHGGTEYVIAWKALQDVFPPVDADALTASVDYRPDPVFPVAFLIQPSKDALSESVFSRTLKRILVPEPGYPQNLWIPFDPDERREKFRTAFRDLETYLDMAGRDRILNDRYRQHKHSTMDAEEVKTRQEQALEKIQQSALHDEFMKKQKSEQDALLRVHRPDLVEIQKGVTHGTANDRVSAFLHFFSRTMLARVLNFPFEDVPEPITDRVDEFIKNYLLSDDDRQFLESLDTLTDDDLKELDNIALTELMEMYAMPFDLSMEVLDEGINDLPLDIRDELISILEEAKQLRDSM